MPCTSLPGTFREVTISQLFTITRVRDEIENDKRLRLEKRDRAPTRVRDHVAWTVIESKYNTKTI